MKSQSLSTILLALALSPLISAGPLPSRSDSFLRLTKRQADAVDSAGAADPSSSLGAAADQFLADLKKASADGDKNEIESAVDDFMEVMKYEVEQAAGCDDTAPSASSAPAADETHITGYQIAAVSPVDSGAATGSTKKSGPTTASVVTEVTTGTTWVSSTGDAVQTSSAVKAGASPSAVGVINDSKNAGSVVTSSTSSAIKTAVTSSAVVKTSVKTTASVTATSTTAAAPAWTSGVYLQPKTQYSGRGGVTLAKKAGLAFNGNSGSAWSAWTSLPGSQIGWGWGWSLNPTNNFPTTTLEFVPMTWGKTDPQTFNNAEANNFGTGSGKVTAILSFNEPDNGGQANLSPQDAAAAHQAIFTQEVAAKYRIGAPSVQFGGEQWFKQWLDACQGKCLFDFVPLHTYFTDVPTIQGYVEQFHNDIGLPVWITEYACMNWENGNLVYCSAAEQTSFTHDLNAWAHETSWIERHSQFGAFEGAAAGTSGAEPIGLENSDGTPDALGKLFATTT